MIVAWYAASVVVAALALADQLRRGESRWVAAGRDRAWWSGVTAALGLLGFGVFVAIAYAVFVLPRFGRDSGVYAGFRKGGAPPPPAPRDRDADGRLIVSFDD